ncbi:MAG: hypothetical protein GC171_08465 [Terrimonas sp.]|nr:hypothetical protein [Terrimonas sp.]
MKHFFNRFATTFLIISIISGLPSAAQVSSVEFGKNRVQYQKFKWKYYQTNNFNTYFSQDGLAIGKYVAQVAEKELPLLEEFMEYGLQRRTNIVVYNNFDELQQSNIGLGIDWQNTGGVTKLVNNKMLVFFDGNHNNLRKQIRQGIAKVILQNVLFGDDLGEFAANQALLDLPEWLTDGYIEYAAEEWNTELDGELKSAILSGRYKNFYQLAFEKPLLAGHAFWKYIGDKFGKSKTTYMLYLARIYRSLNAASQKVTKKKKFKDLLKDFMTEEGEKYFKDIRGRRPVPKGQLAVTEEIRKKDYIRFNANPLPRSFTYAVVEFFHGQYCVVLHENFTEKKVLLKLGTRTREKEINPNYPILAWDGKGTRLACIYSEEGKLKLFVYDLVNRFKPVKNRELKDFDQVQDMKYMLDANTLLLSAVKSGQTDIFTYKIDKETVEQITDDVYDDLDASFVSFPNKTGIIFSSNRPSGTAVSNDETIAGGQYNIFLVDNWNKSEFKQISQLTDLKHGMARFPSQYNTYHFTFVSDENGISNRYAGFFATERAGLDTLVFIGDEILRNPEPAEVDSVMKEWGKTDIDSVGFFSVTNDSSYVFPLTNYQNNLLETRTAGDNSQVSEVIQQGDYKFLYRLRVDEATLRRRNVTAKPTEYMKKVIDDEKAATGRLVTEEADKSDTAAKQNDFFQNEFMNEPADTASKEGKVVMVTEVPVAEPSVLKTAKVFEYRPPKFFNDYIVSGFNNNVLVTRYQPYAGGSGPIRLSNSNSFNGMLRVGTSDLMEDWKFAGGFQISTDLKDNQYIFSTQYLKKRFDYGLTYYRSSERAVFSDNTGSFAANGKIFTNLYQASVSYPFDRVRSLRLNAAFRSDNYVILADDFNNPPLTLLLENQKRTYGLIHLEYVYDDAVNPAQNIWNGLRYKAFFDLNSQLNDKGTANKPFFFNLGGDARYYVPIYRNFIWALRGAMDVSWGTQKMIYYLGGVDNDLFPKFNDANTPDPDGNYAFQTLAVNMRGFNQNVANGNNAIVINSEFRLPVFTTLFNKPINNAFIRNFQLVQFLDLGTAWNGQFDKIERPFSVYRDPGNPNVTVRIKAGGIGPFVGGYGFGVRSTLLGYFLRLDAAWELNGVFRGKPLLYFAMGLDF